MVVCNPLASQLQFLTHRTRFRRDHPKYLTLIESIALLHQYQRPIHERPMLQRADGTGETLRYLEVQPSDIALADEVMEELLQRALDDLAPQVRSFLERLTQVVFEQQQAQQVSAAEPFVFTRRWVVDALGYGEFQVRSYLAQLIDQEYVVVRKGKNGQRYEYQLVASC